MYLVIFSSNVTSFPSDFPVVYGQRAASSLHPSDSRVVHVRGNLHAAAAFCARLHTLSRTKDWWYSKWKDKFEAISNAMCAYYDGVFR